METYLDYNATTPLDPAVREFMHETSGKIFANPSSFHQKGQQARHAIEHAREIVARVIHCEPGDLVFTSGGTEADNLALKGVLAERSKTGRKKLVVSAFEHQAVLHAAKFLQSVGAEVVLVPVDRKGHVDKAALTQAVDENTALVSIMHANNEVGTLQPVKEFAGIAHSKGAWFHTDAVQSFGRIPCDAEELNADLISLSSHKIYGPKGAGALYIKKGIKVRSLFHGGHQEKNVRPGTENVPGILGFGAAADLLDKKRPEDVKRVTPLRDRLEETILKSIPGSHANGDKASRLWNTSSLSFEGLDGETLLMNLDLEHIYVSTGSACTAGSVEPSHVLLAMGIPEPLARGTLRFSLGRFSADADVDRVLSVLPKLIERLRKASTSQKR